MKLWLLWKGAGKESDGEIMDEKFRDSIHSHLMRLWHKYSAMNFKKFTELGIHPGQIPVLGMVYHKEGISPKELAKAIHIKPPTVTVTLQRMEKSGLLYREADSSDLRMNRIYLTEKGRNIVDGMTALIEEDEKILMRGFSEAEAVQFRSYLDRIMDNLVQADGGNDCAECCRRGPWEEKIRMRKRPER